MRVALVAGEPPDDVATWSGIPFHVGRALCDAGIDVHAVDAGPMPGVRYRYWRSYIERAVRRGGSRGNLDPVVLRAYAHNAERQLAVIEPDAVLATDPLVLADLHTDCPTALWADATFDALVDFYPEYSGLPKRQLRAGRWADRQAMQRCDVVFFASRWAAEWARRVHALSDEKVVVVPFGANLRSPPGRADVEDAISGRRDGTCRLLLIGLDWERKRAGFAVEVARDLRGLGVDTILTVIGAPPPRAPLPEWVRCVPFVAKSTQTGERAIGEELARSDFLLLPSRAECFGIVVAEANAYGVPSYGAQVGGVPDAISPGLNGRLFSADDPPSAYATALASVFNDREAYGRLARSSRRMYEERLNWAASVRTVVERLERLVDGARA